MAHRLLIAVGSFVLMTTVAHPQPFSLHRASHPAFTWSKTEEAPRTMLAAAPPIAGSGALND